MLNITFIEIGTPERYLREFDNNLVIQGAKADIVSLYPFGEVNQKGILSSLAQSVQAPSQPTKETAPPSQVSLQATVNETQEKQQKDDTVTKLLRASANKQYNFTPTNSSTPHSVSPRPVALKAHPSGTLRNQPATEINERESAQKEGANRIYYFPREGTK